jgi:uncharacterized protein with von Willebrand factor type A (vWA) domain
MDLSFLSPLGFLLAVGAALPLAAFAIAEVRAGRAAAGLGLPRRQARARATVAGALVLVAALLAVAAAQPVIAMTRTISERTDAEAFVVVDTSRSMLASSGPRAPTRFQRAQAFAIRLRAALPDVPFGLASMTDRALPHLFPTIDRDVFRETVQQVIGIERPPPAGFTKKATNLESLTAIANRSFFGHAARKRVAIVLTDAESRPFYEPGVGSIFQHAPRTDLVIVRFWKARERVYVGGRVDPGYRPDPGSAQIASNLAADAAGRTFDESQLGAAVASIRDYLGTGPRVAAQRERRRVSLAPWAALATLVPVGFLLWRRSA